MMPSTCRLVTHSNWRVLCHLPVLPLQAHRKHYPCTSMRCQGQAHGAGTLPFWESLLRLYSIVWHGWLPAASCLQRLSWLILQAACSLLFLPCTATASPAALQQSMSKIRGTALHRNREPCTPLPWPQAFHLLPPKRPPSNQPCWCSQCSRRKQCPALRLPCSLSSTRQGRSHSMTLLELKSNLLPLIPLSSSLPQLWVRSRQAPLQQAAEGSWQALSVRRVQRRAHQSQGHLSPPARWVQLLQHCTHAHISSPSS